jgi:hypothetical protein
MNGFEKLFLFFVKLLGEINRVQGFIFSFKVSFRFGGEGFGSHESLVWSSWFIVGFDNSSANSHFFDEFLRRREKILKGIPGVLIHLIHEFDQGSMIESFVTQ